MHPLKVCHAPFLVLIISNFLGSILAQNSQFQLLSANSSSKMGSEQYFDQVQLSLPQVNLSSFASPL